VNWATWAVISGAVLAATPLAAQVSPATPATPAQQREARHEIAVLEGILESAVKYGAQMLTQHVQSATVPQSVLLTGLARARGFRLDGYGVLFDVEFPSIRRSVAWSMRELERPDPELLAAMKELRKNTQAAADQRSRQELDRAIKSLEDQIKRMAPEFNLALPKGKEATQLVRDARRLSMVREELERFEALRSEESVLVSRILAVCRRDVDATAVGSED